MQGVVIIKSAGRMMKALGVHEDEIKYCLRDGIYIPTRPSKNIGQSSKLHTLQRRNNNLSVLFFLDNDSRKVVVIGLERPYYRYTGLDKFVPKNHIGRHKIEQKMFKIVNNIPKFEVKQLDAWYHKTRSEHIMCVNEIACVVNDPECRYELTLDRPNTMEQCHLRRTSAYRRACDFMGMIPVFNKDGTSALVDSPVSSPLGLLHETHILKMCGNMLKIREHIKCRDLWYAL